MNVRGVFNGCRAVIPRMKAQGGGKIVNIGSMTSYVGIGNVGIYGMTKSALAQLSNPRASKTA